MRFRFLNEYYSKDKTKIQYVYRNMPHAINNLTVVILSTFLYVTLCAIIFLEQVCVY